jgi:hypothetical protein
MLEHDIQNETWRPVVGFEGRYEVSNKGRIKCLPNRGNHFSHRFLKPVVHRDGYIVIVLTNDKGNKYCKKMHRLVAEAFIQKEKSKDIVHHKDSVKSNNCIENLEWVSKAENTWHASNDGLLSAPRNYSLAKRQLSAQIGKEKCSRPIIQVDCDGNEIAKYPSLTEASKSVGIQRHHIRGVCTGKYAQWRGTYWRYANAGA